MIRLGGGGGQTCDHLFVGRRAAASARNRQPRKVIRQWANGAVRQLLG